MTRYLQYETALDHVEFEAKNRPVLNDRKNLGSVITHRRMPMTNFRNWPTTTSGGACFTDTSPRSCSSCAFDRKPLPNGSLMGFLAAQRGSHPLVLVELLYRGTFQLQNLPLI